MADDTQVSVKIAADASGVQAGVDTAKGAVGDLGDHIAQTAGAVSTHSQAIGASVAAAGASVSTLADRFGALGGSALDAYGKTSALSDQIGKIDSNTRDFTPAIGAAVNEVGALRGVFSAAEAAVGEFGGPLGVAGVAVVGVAQVMHQGGEEVRNFNNAMTATSGYAGLTASAFEQMAERVSAATGDGLGKSKASLTELIATGQFTGDTMGLIAIDAQKMGQLTGQSTAQMLAQFEKAGGSVSQFALDYQRHYGQITVAQYEHIQNLEKEGDTAEAQKVFFQDIYDYLGAQAPQKLGRLEGAWNSLSKGVGAAINAMVEGLKRLDRAKTPAERLADANTQLAAIQDLATHGGSKPLPPAPAHPTGGALGRAMLEKQSAQQAVDANNKTTEAAQKAAAAQKEGFKAIVELDAQLRQVIAGGQGLKQTVQQVRGEVEQATKADPKDKALFAQEGATVIGAIGKRPPPSGGGNSGGGGGGGGAGGGGGHQASQGDDAVSRWREQLAEKLADSQSWYKNQNQLAVDFWQSITTGGQGSAADQKQAALSLAQAREALDKSNVASATDAAKKSADAAGSNVGKVKDIYDTLEKDLARIHQEGGVEWDKIEAAKKEATDKSTVKMQAAAIKTDGQKGADAVEADQSIGKDTNSSLDLQASQVKSQAKVGQINPDQEATQLAAINAQKELNDKATIARVLQDQEDAFDREVADANENNAQLEGITTRREAAERAARQQTEAINRTSSQRMGQDAIDAAERTAQAWKTNVGSIVQSFGSGVLNMAQHGGSFQQVMMGVVGTIEQNFARSVETMVTSFIVGETTKKTVAVTSQAAQTAAATSGEAERATTQQAGAAQSLLISLETTLQTVTNNAVSAASAAFQYFANMGPLAIPLGAAAAAATFTVVEAFGALASASGGYDIGNENPLTQLHAQEMVLPASIATPLRGMIAANSNGAGGGSGGSGGGGDTYNMAINALDSRSLKRTMNNPGNVRAAAGAFAKHG